MALENKLTLRTVTSPFSGQFPGQIPDVTTSAVISLANLDNNQLYLKGETIFTATTSGSTTTLFKLNGGTLSFPSGSGGGSGSITGGTVIISSTTANGGSILFSGDNTGFYVDLTPMAGSGLTIDNTTGQFMLDLGSTLPTPIIHSSWVWRKNDNTTPLGNSTAQGISVPHGAFVDLVSSQFIYTLSNTDSEPTTISGSYGTTNLGPGILTPVTPISDSGITINKTFTVTFTKPSSGLQVVNHSNIQFASGNDTTSNSSNVTFKNNWYEGSVTSQSPSDIEINALIDSDMLNDVLNSFSKGNVTVDGSHYHLVAYPIILGTLTNIIMDGAAPILGAYTQLSNIFLTNNTGLSVECFVYVSNALGPFTNNDLTFYL